MYRLSTEYPAYTETVCVLDVNCFELLKSYHYRVAGNGRLDSAKAIKTIRMAYGEIKAYQ